MWRQSPLTSEQREIAKGKRLEIIAGRLCYPGKESISRKSFEVPLFMLHSSSSDRYLYLKAIDGLVQSMEQQSLEPK